MIPAFLFVCLFFFRMNRLNRMICEISDKLKAILKVVYNVICYRPCKGMRKVDDLQLEKA